jgi:hypothetical protein
MMRFLIATLAILAASCAPSPSPSPDQIISVASLTAEQCAARRGVMQPVGRAQTLQCIFRYADAGARCTDGDQCLGDCRVPDGVGDVAPNASVTGVCQADTNRFGCNTTIENGRAQPTLCID